MFKIISRMEKMNGIFTSRTRMLHSISSLIEATIWLAPSWFTQLFTNLVFCLLLHCTPVPALVLWISCPIDLHRKMEQRVRSCRSFLFVHILLALCELGLPISIGAMGHFSVSITLIFSFILSVTFWWNKKPHMDEHTACCSI